MTNQNVVEFVYHQHQELFRCLRVPRDKIRIDQQSWLDQTFDRRRRHAGALDDVEKTQQSRQGIGSAREGVEDPFRNRRCGNRIV